MVVLCFVVFLCDFVDVFVSLRRGLIVDREGHVWLFRFQIDDCHQLSDFRRESGIGHLLLGKTLRWQVSSPLVHELIVLVLVDKRSKIQLFGVMNHSHVSNFCHKFDIPLLPFVFLMVPFVHLSLPVLFIPSPHSGDLLLSNL